MAGWGWFCRGAAQGRRLVGLSQRTAAEKAFHLGAQRAVANLTLSPPKVGAAVVEPEPWT